MNESEANPSANDHDGNGSGIYPGDSSGTSIDVLPAVISVARVFISHSSVDAEKALHLTLALERSGVNCWIAPRNILPGTEYNAAIMDGLNNASALVLLFSRHSNDSDPVLREVERASNRKIPVIPVRLENVVPSKGLEYLISTRQWINAYPAPFDRHLNRIVDGVRQILALPSQTPLLDSAEFPDYIGNYRLLGKIGEGGFGTVFKAEERGAVKRIVALKLIKPGLDTKEVIARFESERQALARMDHPHVAKVLGAGADHRGRPYFVMEFVPGMPITTFCDELKLSIRQRLELFLQVCDAITHAHTKGLIHRDIKNSNVLAYLDAGRPQAKVIDFGIAKALTGDRLTDRTLATEQGRAMGTYGSMSPEQASGSDDIDTRTDVYALGALLYELLAGTPPFDEQTLSLAADDEKRRIIREVAPPKPSTRISSLREKGTPIAAARQEKPESLTKHLRCELEWIPLMALRKERDRRYASPAAMAGDIENFLAGRPLLAGPESIEYRLRKWVGVHRAVLATIASFVLFAITAVGIYIRDIRIEQQRTLAQRVAAEQARNEAVVAMNRAVSERTRAEESLYVAHMNLAARAWERHDTAGVLELLREHLPQPGTPDLRGFEWYYLWRKCHEEPRLLGHNGPVKAVAFSPGNKLLASASFDHLVRLWDLETRQSIAPLDGATAPLFCIAFSPDGRLVAAGGGDRMMRIWNVQDRTPLFELPQDDVITTANFSPDGKTLATGGDDNRVWLWDLASRKVRAKLVGHSEHVHSVAYSPDGSLLASGSGDGTVRLWDPVTGKLVRELEGIVPDIFPIAFSPDGQLLAAGTTEKSVLIWDLSDNRLVARLGGHLDRVEAVAFSPDGQLLVSADGGGLMVYWRREGDQRAWSKTQEVRAHVGSIYSIAFSADGGTLATGSGDTTIRLFGPMSAERQSVRQTRRPEVLSGFNSSVNAIAFQDGTGLLFSGTEDGRVFVHRYAQGMLLTTIEGDPQGGAVNDLAISHDGSRLAVGRGVWDNSGSVELWQIDGDPSQWHRIPTTITCRNTITSLDFSPDDRFLAIAGFEPESAIWNVAAVPHKLVHKLYGHSHWVNDIVFSPDGQQLATASQDYSVCLWDAATGRRLQTYPQSGMVRCVAFSPADRNLLVAGGWDWTLRLIALDGTVPARLLKGHRGAVNTVTFSSDGAVLASGSIDGTVKIWRASLGQELLTLGELSSDLHASVEASDRRQIHKACFDATRRMLAAASGDGCVRLWWHNGQSVEVPH